MAKQFSRDKNPESLTELALAFVLFVTAHLTGSDNGNTFL